MFFEKKIKTIFILKCVQISFFYVSYVNIVLPTSFQWKEKFILNVLVKHFWHYIL